MPLKHHIIGLKNIHINRVEEDFITRKVIIFCQYKGPRRCSHCDSKKVHSGGWRARKLKHSRTGNQLVELCLRVLKLRCLSCKRSSMQRVEHVRARYRSTETFRMEVYEQHLGGVAQRRFVATHKTSSSTVERWYKGMLQLKAKETQVQLCPQILGIDEHFFTKKKGYATTFVDLKNHRVFDVQLGRSAASLDSYLLSLKGRDRVQVVLMDLSSTYRSIATKYFPNAMIVADRFHVVRLIQQQMQRVWASLDPFGRSNRGLLSLFRRKPENLRPEQKQNLEKYLNGVAGLRQIYDFCQELLDLMRLKTLNKQGVKKKIPRLLEMTSLLQDSPFDAFRTLGNTISDWMEPIARMWRFSKTNSITEGFHNKMEMISRRAFGFRNFQNYRLRVLALCGNDGLFNRVDIGT